VGRGLLSPLEVEYGEKKIGKSSKSTHGHFENQYGMLRVSSTQSSFQSAQCLPSCASDSASVDHCER